MTTRKVAPVLNADRRRKVTMSDVARAAGVSRTTASQALSGTGRVSPETQELVRKLAGELGFTPSARALALRTGRTRMIVLANSIPVGDSPGEGYLDYYAAAAAAAAEEALKDDYTLALVPPTTQSQWAQRLEIDGAIVMDPLADDAAIATLSQRGIPFVTLGRVPDGDANAQCSVDADFDYGTRLVMDHLRVRGSRSPALITTLQHRGYSSTTVDTYMTWCAEERVEPVALELDEAGAAEAGHAAMLELFTRRPAVDAVFAPFDRFSSGILAAADKEQRVLGSDFRFVTLEGTRARTNYPRLTALDDNATNNARRATRRLLEGLKESSYPTGHELTTPHLIQRAST